MSEKIVQDPHAQRFVMHRIFLKKSAFEGQKISEVFQDPWDPEAQIELNFGNTKLEDENFYEVSLSAKVVMQSNKKEAYTVGVTELGVFEIANYKEEELAHLLGAYCLNTLFPYLREEISGLVVRGGFPPLVLAPCNFEAVYAQKMAEKAKK